MTQNQLDQVNAVGFCIQIFAISASNVCLVLFENSNEGINDILLSLQSNSTYAYNTNKTLLSS